MDDAAMNGYEAIVRLCHDWGATPQSVDWAMAEAAGSGHEAIVRLCHEWGATPRFVDKADGLCRK